MATITLGTLRDYWKRVYDAITGPPGSAAPTYAMQVGGTDGTNLRALKTDASGNLSVLLNGSIIESVGGADALRIKQVALAYTSWNLNGADIVTIAAGSFIRESTMHEVNGFGRLAFIVRNYPFDANTKWVLQVDWAGMPNPQGYQFASETLLNHESTPAMFDAGMTETKSQWVRGVLTNKDSVDISLHCHFLLRAG